jgi:RNA polymerase sigma factor (sigma-70 family)
MGNYRPDPTKPPKLGPEGRAEWDPAKRVWRLSLTPAGQAAFEKWVAEHPNPLAVVNTSSVRGFVRVVLTKGEDEARAAALVGVWLGFLHHDPSRGSLGGTVVAWVIQQLTGGTWQLTESRGRGRTHLAGGDEIGWDTVASRAVRWWGTAAVPDPVEVAEEQEEGVRLQRAMGELSPRDRTVVRMRLAGRPNRETGDAIGVTAERVRVLQKRALKKLAFIIQR